MLDTKLENQSGTLQAILEKVADQAARKADYVTSTNNIQVRTIDGNTNVVLEADRGVPTQSFATNDVAFSQLANNCDIDVRTARRLRDNDSYAPEFDALLNKILVNEPKNKMLRTLSGERPILRALVSDKFKTFDNLDLVQSALPQLIHSDSDWQIVNGTVTDSHLYMRLKSANQIAEPAIGDTMANGILLRNSEVGLGSVEVAQLAWTLWCLNGCTTENKSRHTHVTSARGGDQWALLTDEAKNADNKALELKLRDVVAAFSSRESFDAHVDLMRAAHGDLIEGSASAAVNATIQVLKLPKKSADDLMTGLLNTLQQDGYRNKAISRATIVNAVTACAHTAKPDDVDSWYQNGRAVLDLPANQWSTIARAA
tara:strand:- start:811 stop:1926 length:1116 start_codon:yes stop_codon:yes gene_type:complete